MKVCFVDNTYKTSKITGSQHNFLGLQLEEKDCFVEPKIVDLSEKLAKKNVSPEMVKQQVLIALEELNDLYATNFTVIKIEFLGIDIYTTNVYEELTKIILKSIIKDK